MINTQLLFLSNRDWVCILMIMILWYGVFKEKGDTEMLGKIFRRIYFREKEKKVHWRIPKRTVCFF